MIYFRIRKFITHITDNISLQAKIQLMFLLFFMLPLLLFTLLSYRRTNTLIRNQTISSMDQTYEESMDILNRYFRSMQDSMSSLLYESDLHALAARIRNGRSVFEQQSYYLVLERQFGFIQKMSDIDFVRLYMDGSFPYMQNDISLFSFDQTKETP